MRKWNHFLAVMALGLFMASAATADTLELKDGRVLKGKYLGGTQVVLRFEINGEVQTFNTIDLVALTFTAIPVIPFRQRLQLGPWLRHQPPAWRPLIRAGM